MISPITTKIDGEILSGEMTFSPYTFEVFLRKPVRLSAPMQANLSSRLDGYPFPTVERIGKEMLKRIYMSLVTVAQHKEKYQECFSWYERNKDTLKIDTPLNPSRCGYDFDLDEPTCEVYAIMLLGKGLPLIQPHAVGHILEAIKENPDARMWKTKTTYPILSLYIP